METFKGEIVLGKLLEGCDAVLIDIVAEWCAPCKDLAVILEELEPLYVGKVKFVKVDVSSYAPEFVRDLNVRAVPTILFYKGGKLISREAGLKSKEKIIEEIKRIYDEKKK